MRSLGTKAPPAGLTSKNREARWAAIQAAINRREKGWCPHLIPYQFKPKEPSMPSGPQTNHSAKKEARQLYAKGMEVKNIAKKTGIPYDSVYAYVHYAKEGRPKVISIYPPGWSMSQTKLNSLFAGRRYDEHDVRFKSKFSQARDQRRDVAATPTAVATPARQARRSDVGRL
jgi:hypothetical protein